MTRLSKHQKWFAEQAIRLDQSHRDGKTIVSTAYLSMFTKRLSLALEDIQSGTST